MTKLDQLADLLLKAPDDVFIQPHNVPDPDAIAACFGLQYMLGLRGVESVIVYDNDVEKANSLKMLELFGITMVKAEQVATMGEEDWTVLVDVQKHNSNLTDLVTEEVACIDHHELNGLDRESRFVDIRPETGACSSIIADYFVENHIEIPREIATALLYGIFLDTSDLSRGVSELDIEMFYRLYRLSDISLITELKGNQISQGDLHDYARAFDTVEIYDEVGFLYLDNCNDSLLGAAGDMVLSIAGVNVVVAYSPRPEGIKFSLRSIDGRVSAEAMVKELLKDGGFGGGHRSMAGGFLPRENLPEKRSIHTFVRHRAIAYLEEARA